LACGLELDHGGRRFRAGALRAGEERGKGEDADAWGRRGRERREGERACERGGKWRRHAGPGSSERKRDESAQRAGLAAGPGTAHAGRGKERGARGEREGEFGLGWAAFPFFFPFLLFLFFSTLKLFKPIYLNSNKFEFKPYKLNTRKIMLQHECTTILTLEKILFSYVIKLL
jgi:hypothetical protein